MCATRKLRNELRDELKRANAAQRLLAAEYEGALHVRDERAQRASEAQLRSQCAAAERTLDAVQREKHRADMAYKQRVSELDAALREARELAAQHESEARRVGKSRNDLLDKIAALEATSESAERERSEHGALATAAAATAAEGGGDNDNNDKDGEAAAAAQMPPPPPRTRATSTASDAIDMDIDEKHAHAKQKGGSAFDATHLYRDEVLQLRTALAQSQELAKQLQEWGTAQERVLDQVTHVTCSECGASFKEVWQRVQALKSDAAEQSAAVVAVAAVAPEENATANEAVKVVEHVKPQEENKE